MTLPLLPLPMRRRFAPLLVALAIGVVACGDGDDWSAQAIATDAGVAVMPVLVNSQVGVGLTQLAFGLWDGEGTLVADASVELSLYTLAGDSGSLVSEHQLVAAGIELDGVVHVHDDGSSHPHAGPRPTLFIAEVNLTQPEWWGAELRIRMADGALDPIRLRFWVVEHTAEPAVGDLVPRTLQLVLRDVADIREIDSSPVPNPALHELTVAEALDAGKPLVVAFASPALCQTRFCGPVVEQVVTPLWERYGDRVSVMHIEPFDLAAVRAGASPLEAIAPAMSEWGLGTEPWIFVVDGNGRLVAKFEGIMSGEVVSQALERALSVPASD